MSLILQGYNAISPKLSPTFGHGFVSEDGDKLLEVLGGKDYVEVEFTTCDFRKTTDENNRLAAGGKKDK